METVMIIRLVGFVLAGIGAGYLGSLILCQCATNRVVSNRRAMAIIGGLVGIGLTFAISVAHDAKAPSLPSLSTTNQLDEALAGAVDKPVVVVFYAEWCPPSRKLLPDVEHLQQDQKEDVAMYKVNVDEAIELRRVFNIRSIPTLVYFQNGCEVDRTIGVVGKPTVAKRLTALASAAEARRPKP